MVLKALNDYRPVYSGDMQDQQQPLMICVTGPMEQIRLDFDYHGFAVSEKFHIEPLNLSVIPCNPYIAETLKDLAHPQTAPQQFTGNGYALFDYVVILDMNHTGPVSHLERARERENEEMRDDNNENGNNDGNPQVEINLPGDDELIGDPVTTINNDTTSIPIRQNDEDPEDFINDLFNATVNTRDVDEFEGTTAYSNEALINNSIREQTANVNPYDDLDPDVNINIRRHYDNMDNLFPDEDNDTNPMFSNELHQNNENNSTFFEKFGSSSPVMEPMIDTCRTTDSFMTPDLNDFNPPPSRSPSVTFIREEFPPSSSAQLNDGVPGGSNSPFSLKRNASFMDLDISDEERNEPVEL
ncbi:hypothetical protein BD770DRAFT_403752, partial [Pilaira anomala]